MKIYTRLVFDIETGTIIESDSYEYTGPVALCCGASDSQNQIEQQQQSQYSQMQQQAQQVFGASSSVFNQLQKTFQPIVAAGPSQQGFSPAEASNLKSGAITETGQAYKNAKAAVGNATAAQGGGNDPGLTGGVSTGTDIAVANAAAGKTADQLNQINEANYQTGRENFNNATKTLEGSTQVFDPAVGFDNATTGSGKAAADTANEIASQDNSWVQGVTGALGGVASAATGGIIKNMGSGKSQ